MEKEHRKELYKEMVRAGKRTYFFDVKESVDGDLYLQIQESIKKGDSYERSNILVFEDNILAFAKSFKKVCGFIVDRIIK